MFDLNKLQTVGTKIDEFEVERRSGFLTRDMIQPSVRIRISLEKSPKCDKPFVRRKLEK